MIALDFLGQGALLEPADRKLHDAAMEFAWRELADGETLNFTKFAKVWVGLKDKQVFGLAGYVLRPDVPLLRATDVDVLRALCQRMNSFFADNGARGQQALIYIGNEKEEQRCPQWREMLREFKAEKARRFMIEVK